MLLGVLIAVNYSYSTLTTKNTLIKGDYKIWQVSATYNAGEKVIVSWRYAQAWTQGEDELPDDVTPVFHKHIWWEIVDPSNGTTEFNTAFTSYGPGGQKLTGFFLAYVNVTIRAAGLNVTEQYPKYIGGIALLNGTYTARCVQDFEPPLIRPTPPYWLGLEKEVTVVQYPYTSLLPIGISVSGVGAVVSVAAARSSKKNKSGKI